MTNFGNNRLLDYRFPVLLMIKGNRFYFQYEGYEGRYGNSRRPALLRYSKKYIPGNRFSPDEELEIVTLYIDGKSIENTLGANQSFSRDAYGLMIIEPNQSNQRDTSSYNLIARPFDADSITDWGCLFYDSSYFSQMGDRLAYAIIVIALDKYNLSIPVLTDALNSLQEPSRSLVIDLIRYASYGLSKSKINTVNELNRVLGRPSDAFFPQILEDAAKQFGIYSTDLNVHSLVDLLFEKAEEKEIKNPRGFCRFIQWLKDDSFSLSLQELDSFFAYLGESKRCLAIRRFFFDVKRGVFNYDIESLKAFSSQNYQYYSTLRYIFEGWPGNRNVSTEFLLDCLKTYEQTNQQRFQVSEGILDWAIQKSIEVNRPVEMNFNDWLCYCEGGILINKAFRGFANFAIQYEIDDYAFEEDSLRNSIHAIVRRDCLRLYHDEIVPQIDPESGSPAIDPETQQPITTIRRVYENRWKIRNQGKNKFVNLFVNWEKKPETETEKDVFTPEMVDYSIVRNNVEKYLQDKYGTISPYVSERSPDDIVKMFSYENRMRVHLDDGVTLGENPGVDESVVKKRIKERMVELFGETLECEYDQQKYHTALRDSLFRLTEGSPQCFEKREKMYRWERKIYCAPELTEKTHLLTGRKWADCQNDMCFVTCIKKAPDWKQYTLIHILEIIGYHVLDETEAGLIPTPVYIQFVTQINKAIRFTKRLICRECGHILFPARQQGHSKFKCLLLSCPEYNKEVYLNYCHDCKKGIIDSRDTKQCPNGMYICPSCDSCCSNKYFESMAERYRIIGKKTPSFILRNIGNGHRDRNMFFCNKCGAQKVDIIDGAGNREWRCLVCNPLKEKDDSAPNSMEEIPPDTEGNTALDIESWA